MRSFGIPCLSAMVALGVLGCARPATLPGSGEVRASHLSPELAALLDDAARMCLAAMTKDRIPGLAIALTDEKELL
jgi:hypothetical protein